MLRGTCAFFCLIAALAVGTTAAVARESAGTAMPKTGDTCVSKVHLDTAQGVDAPMVRATPQPCLPEPCKAVLSPAELGVVLGRSPDHVIWETYFARYAQACRHEAIWPGRDNAILSARIDAFWTPILVGQLGRTLLADAAFEAGFPVSRPISAIVAGSRPASTARRSAPGPAIAARGGIVLSGFTGGKSGGEASSPTPDSSISTDGSGTGDTSSNGNDGSSTSSPDSAPSDTVGNPSPLDIGSSNGASGGSGAFDPLPPEPGTTGSDPAPDLAVVPLPLPLVALMAALGTLLALRRRAI